MVKKLANVNKITRETSKFTRPDGAGIYISVGRARYGGL